MAETGISHLHEAIARNTAIVLSLPSAGMARHQKSRLLSLESDGGIWVESTHGSDALIAELIATQRPLGVTLKAGTQKITFIAPITRLTPEFVVNETIRVPALLLGNPSEVQTVQRRNCYRVRLFDDSELAARMWRIPDHAILIDRPMASMEVMATLLDISLGGLGVRLRPRLERAAKIADGERLRIELIYREQSLIVEGRTRSASAPDSSDEAPRLGVKFKPLERDLEDRQKAAQLARIIGELQRDEVRRARRASA